jgi:hypothetical protein
VTTHQEAKVVTRYEVWCDECVWATEYADPDKAHAARRRHELRHDPAYPPLPG